MSKEFPRGYYELVEYFDGDNISTAAADGIKWLVSSDTGDTAFAPLAGALGPGARGATTTTDDNLIELAHGLLTFSAQNGSLKLTARMQLDVVTNVAFTIGFNDDALEDSNTLPVELSGTTFTSNSSTFFGVVFDVDATNDEFHAFWVDDDADSASAIADLRMKGIAPVAGEWFTVEVELQDQGSGKQARGRVAVHVSDGTEVKSAEKVFASTVDRDALLTPHFGVENRSGTAHTVTVGPVMVQMSLPVS